MMIWLILLVEIISVIHLVEGKKPFFPKIIPTTLSDHARSEVKSTLKVLEQHTYPDLSRWAICDMCGIGGDHSIKLFRKSVKQVKKARKIKREASPFNLTISYSQWKEFFYTNNDKFHIQVKEARGSDSKPEFLVSRPIFIVPMITFHVGHLLVDLLEGIYHAMMSKYGKIRKDAIIILDVASPDHSARLETIISNSVGGQGDISDVDPLSNAFQLMSSISDTSIFTLNQLYKKILPSLPANVVFQHIHIGLDTSKSFYYRGYRYHPHSLGSPIWNTGSRVDANMQMQRSNQWQRLAGPHRSFQEHIENYVTSLIQPPTEMESMPDEFLDTSNQMIIGEVMLVQRQDGNRMIMNLNEVVDEFKNHLNVAVSTSTLEDMTLRQQIIFFRESKVLMGVAGTTLHNILFVPTEKQRRGEHGVVIVMQSAEWCDYAWMFSNQAVLLGSHAVILCPPETGEAVYDVPGEPEVVEEDTEGVVEYHKMHKQMHQKSLSVVAGVRRIMHQGPRTTKFINVTVNVAKDMIPAVKELFACMKNNQRLNKKGISKNVSLPLHITKRHDALLLEKEQDPTVLTSSIEDPLNIQITGVLKLDKLLSAMSRKKYAFKLGTEIIGPKAILSTLLDDRYFPHLGTCMQQSQSRVCISLADVGYLGDFDITMDSMDIKIGLTLRLVTDETVTVQSSRVLDSSSFFVANAELFSKSKITSTVLLPTRHHGANEFRFGYKYGILSFQKCIMVETGEMISDLWLLEVNINQITSLSHMFKCPEPQIRRYLQVPDGIYVWNGNQLMQNIHSRRVFQTRLGEFCENAKLDYLTCGNVAGMVSIDVFQQQALVPHFQLPPRQWMPSVTSPFVFLHMEKCAGTTMRSLLNDAAKVHGLTSFIPCMENISCNIFRLPKHQPSPIPPVISSLQTTALLYETFDLSNVSVIGGHFQWGEWTSLPACTGDDCDVSCFIMYREPVERVVSQYYERVYNEKADRFYQVPINDLTEEQLMDVMYTHRWGRWLDEPKKGEKKTDSENTNNKNRAAMIVDEGFSDVMCRSLLGRKTTSGQLVHFDDRDNAHDLSLPVRNETVDYATVHQRMRQCVVGLQGEWESTLRVISHWFPWIQFSPSVNVHNLRLHATKHKDGNLVKNLRPELKEIIEAYNECDLMVYEEAKQRFQLQMNVLETAGYVP